MALTRTQSFAGGVPGELAALVLAEIVSAQYSGYSTRARTSEMLAAARPLRDRVEANVLRLGTVRDSGSGVDVQELTQMQRTFRSVSVREDGLVLLEGANDGQMIVWIPSLSAGKVAWTCLGGSRRVVPSSCRC